MIDPLDQGVDLGNLLEAALASPVEYPRSANAQSQKRQRPEDTHDVQKDQGQERDRQDPRLDSPEAFGEFVLQEELLPFDQELALGILEQLPLLIELPGTALPFKTGSEFRDL